MLSRSQGVSGGCGGLAEYAVVDEHLAHILPEGVSCMSLQVLSSSCTLIVESSVEMGAMIEPLAVAWHAVKQGNVKDGCSALILGAGPVSRSCVVSSC